MQVLYQLSYGPISMTTLESCAVDVIKFTPQTGSHLPPDRHESALHLNLIRRQLNGFVSRVSRLEHNNRALAMKVLEGGTASSHESADHGAIAQALRIVHRLHQHHIAVGDMGIHHRVTIHGQGEQTPGLENRCQIEMFLYIVESCDQSTSGNGSQHGNTSRSGHITQELQCSCLTLLPGDPAFLLKMSQTALNGCRRPQPHRLHHLPDRGAVPVGADVIRQPVVQLLLRRGQGFRDGIDHNTGIRQYICTARQAQPQALWLRYSPPISAASNACWACSRFSA